MKKLFATLFSFVIVIFFASSTSFAGMNLVKNGDFEDFTGATLLSDKGSWRLYSAIPGWQILGNSGEVELQNGLFGSNKTWYAELDADTKSGQTNVVLSQELDLVHGQQYTISFDYMNRQGAGNPTGGVLVELAGWSLQTFGTIANWQTFTGHFTYDSNLSNLSNILMVTGLGNNDRLGALVDNFKVTAVPLPAAAWMLGAGLVALVRVRRRMNR